MAWTRGTLTALAAVGVGLAVAAALWDASRPPVIHAGERPSVIFVVVETLRADHIRAWGHGRDTMPILEDVAREGVLFDRAVTAAPWTLPSVTSILTGLAPSVHSVTTYEDVVPSDVTTLAERFSAAGYETAFFGVNSLFEADRNVEQGFTTYYGIDEIPGTELNEHITAFLRTRDPSKPLFMYLHYFEPHCRYNPPTEMQEMYLPAPPDLATGRTITLDQLHSMHECFHLYRRSGEPILDIDHYLGEYDAEIRYVDHLIGLTLERLKTAGLFDQSLVAILGDHGEEFWEHGTFGHGRSLNEAAVHVPLVIRPPGGISARRFAPPVSTLDLAPTALSVAGLDHDADLQGEDLSPIWLGGSTQALDDRAVFSETDYETFHFRSVHQGDLKLVVNLDGGPPALYDLKADPSQSTNLAERDHAAVARLGQALEAHLADSRDRAADLGTAKRPIPDDVVERLRALGYTL